MTSTDSAWALPSLSSGPAGLVASLGLHAAVLVALATLVRPAALPDALEQAVLVELVTAPAPPVPTPAQALPETAPSGLDTPDRSDADTAVAPPAAASDMIEATTLMAGAALADPRNAEARRMLGMIEDSLRREQVCGIEAMEQIASRDPVFSPECVISYAFADPETKGDQLIAMGATVQSGTQWYRLEYECTLGADLASVTAFRYRIGDPVSEAERDRLGLAPCK